ncbi:MAG TPA: hypothetical protein DCS19_01710 [Flavobacterium sp.]|nr:hypothetical protein [Flavobacterium sp.]
MAKITLIKKKARDIVKAGINAGKSQAEISESLTAYLKSSKKAFETDKKRNFADIEAEMKRYKEFLFGATAKPEARQIATKVLKEADKDLVAVWKNSPEEAIKTVEEGLKDGKSASELSKSLSKKFNLGEFRANTIVRTAKKGFNRLNTIQQALSAGVENFKYAGPTSGTEHDLCKRNVGKVFSISEIRKMRNGQREPVEAYMGGYNCRHHWEPVVDSVDSKKEVAPVEEKDLLNAIIDKITNNKNLIKAIEKIGAKFDVVKSKSGSSISTYLKIKKQLPDSHLSDDIYVLRLSDHNTTMRNNDWNKSSEIMFNYRYSPDVEKQILELHEEYKKANRRLIETESLPKKTTPNKSELLSKVKEEKQAIFDKANVLLQKREYYVEENAVESNIELMLEILNSSNFDSYADFETLRRLNRQKNFNNKVYPPVFYLKW